MRAKEIDSTRDSTQSFASNAIFASSSSFYFPLSRTGFQFWISFILMELAVRIYRNKKRGRAGNSMSSSSCYFYNCCVIVFFLIIIETAVGSE